LSAWYVYAILCNGVDRGASIGEALNLVTARGTCLDASVPHGTINPRKLSAADTAEAQPGSRWRSGPASPASPS
jgi:hypothetical protein